jgi:glycosyltransferase involved in cell wall biosynthesis
MRICVVTKIASPYQVELFDELTSHGGMELDVVYVYPKDDQRFWKAPQTTGHSCTTLYASHSFAGSEIQDRITQADLTVFSWYRDPIVEKLIRARVSIGRPLCLWGERPGFRQPGLLGRLYRRWKLRALLDTPAPIWGIGTWAVEGYRQELGTDRHYLNVPYVSNLDRFRPSGGAQARAKSDNVTILYSGSLIHRKGVDLLAASFKRVAHKTKRVRLAVVGAGSLRPRMEKALATLNDRVEFHGFQQWSELPRFYQHADILVAPSRYDGWGLTVLEGMAAGLPVIATDRMGAAREVISDGHNGWLIAADSGVAIDNAMDEALALDNDQRARMSVSATESAQSFSLAAGVQRFRDAAASTLSIWHENSSRNQYG